MRVTPLPLVAATCLIGVAGCAGRHAIVAATGTNIGVEISENPQTQAPYAKLGYQRTEWAIVPTNRTGEKGPGDTEHSAKDHGEVLMELRYGGIFDTGPSSGIYQRLAIGRTAVTQPGAAFMFARDADGGINSTTAAALQSALTIPWSRATSFGSNWRSAASTTASRRTRRWSMRRSSPRESGLPTTTSATVSHQPPPATSMRSSPRSPT